MLSGRVVYLHDDVSRSRWIRDNKCTLVDLRSVKYAPNYASSSTLPDQRKIKAEHAA